MIGVFKPRLDELSGDAAAIVRRVHCTGCVSVRACHSWLTSLVYPYETDLLLYLVLGSKPGTSEPETTRTVCTAVPVMPRSLLKLETHQRSALAAFSVVVAWCCLDDHARDGDRRLARMMKKIVDPRLAWSMHRLGIPPDSITDPRGLRNVDESRIQTLPDLLDTYRPLISGIWQSALKSLDCRASAAWQSSMGDSLSDLMLLMDAVADYHEDQRTGAFNPIRDTTELQAARELLQRRLSTSLLLTTLLASPWRGIVESCISSTVQSILNSQERSNIP